MQNNLGALVDNRTRKERDKDYRISEVVARADAVKWEDRPPRQFPIRSQDGSSACVAFSAAKMMGILQYANKGGRFVDFSPAYLYKRRMNSGIGDGQGMWAYDMWGLLQKEGITLDPLMPSDGLSEEKINAVPEIEVYRDVAQLFRVENYVTYEAGRDFDVIAGTILKTGKGVITWFTFNSNEWTTMPTIKTSSPQAHHSVCAVDAVIYKGNECIVIDDSWGSIHGSNGQRFITREFFEARNTYAAYPIAFKTEQSDMPRPRYVFKYPMKIGQVSPDIKVLQDVLKYESLFPTNIDSTGKYGEITRKAVLDFQFKHKIANETELVSLNGKVVGSKTLYVLNKLYK